MIKASMMLMITLLFPSLASCRATSDANLQVVKTKDNYQILAGLSVDKEDKLKGKLAIKIQATKGWKFNKKAPVIIDIEEQKTMGLSKTRLKKKDAVRTEKKSCLFEVPFKATQKGSHTLKHKFDFVICTDTLCQKKRFELTYKLSAG
jgi:hypothetical protein